MLSRLTIQNFALIDSMTLEFDPKLNILTGETGAGKSILLDALSFALGERFEGARPSLTGKPCSAEVVFEAGQALRKNSAFEAFLSEEDDMVILRRELTADGRTRCWINNRAATVSALKEAGRFLVDIHGQHDHQLLLDPASHLEMVDRLSKTEDLLAEYKLFFVEYRALLQNQHELRALEEGREREMDLLKYQIEEIESLALQEGEDEELQIEKIRLANSEKLHEIISRALGLLSEDDISASGLIGKAFRELSSLAKLDPSTETYKSEFENAQLGFEEVIRSLKEYEENLPFDADRLKEIEERLERIDLVKRKYGASVTKALEFLAEAKEKYDKLLNSGVYEQDIQKKLKSLTPQMEDLAEKISAKRKKSAQVLKQTVEAELKDLGITNAKFECKLEKIDFSENGRDRLEFLISTNLGEPLAPLRKIISGGEASRVMLAMKKALMAADPVETLIFDEIDANIGGRLGTVTGEKLKEIAAERQVLLITHLPQIASFANRHFKVSKKIRQGKTTAEYEVLEGDARVRELAQMMSGKQETEISRKHAEEMLTQVKHR